MNVFRRTVCGLIAGSSLLTAVSLLAQSAANESAPPAPLKSPVAVFRELLAMEPAERKQALAIRPPPIQERLAAKLQEYEILPPDFREQRLRETELRWYLLPLMAESRTNRAARLALIPEDQRKLVGERLEQWDLLPPPLQKELLNSELTADYFSQLQSAVTEKERQQILEQISPERRAELESGLERWRNFSESQRQKLLSSFNGFFELTPREKKKALNTLSDSERQQMEKTLEAYANLTPAQRVQCIRSFEKFAGMSLPQRQLFLKNAERWKEMSPGDREAWRQLVTVAPIMPITENTSSLPSPLSHRANASAATN
jgi:hypothetical protein